MANKVVNVPKALDKPESHDPNGAEMKRTMEDGFLGVAVVPHLGDEGREKELIKLLALVLGEAGRD